MEAKSSKEKYRGGLPPIPFRLQRLPVERGYPVPWFVAEVDGHYDFRIADPSKIVQAVNEKRCYTCGQPLGRYLAFPIGPMCAINRTTAEPPSHRECAEWSIKACPFLTQRQSKRRETGLPEVQHPPGHMIRRQPGAVLLWITKFYSIFRDPNGGVLFRLGDPEETLWFREGRTATREEIIASIDSGYPLLMEMAEREGPRSVRQLPAQRSRAMQLIPPPA